MKHRWIAVVAAVAALLMPAAATADPANAPVPFLLHNFQTPANATFNGYGNQLTMTGGGTTTFLRFNFVKVCGTLGCEGFYHYEPQNAGAGGCMKENVDNRVVITATGCETGDTTVNEQQEYWTDVILPNGKIVLYSLYNSAEGIASGCLGDLNECTLESYANRVDTNGTFSPLGSGPNTQWTFVNQG